MSKRQTLILILIALVILVADRLSKFFVIKKLLDSSGVFIIKKSWLSLSLVKSLNTELAFSIPLPTILILILTANIIGILIWYFIKQIKNNQFVEAILLEIIILSASNNFFDRIYYKGVVDFISIKIFSLNWAIFNLADVFITIGTILLFLKLVFQKSIQPKH